jgi:hypothetical protein
MNKLVSPIFNKKSWGAEVVWAITDSYICKTIEVNPLRTTDLIVYEKKEKLIIIVEGVLVLALGECCDEDHLEYYEHPTGWSDYIGPGKMHRYGATDKPVRIIEISTPEIDEAIIVKEF